MKDNVTSLIKNYDITGSYLDRDAFDSLKSYFASGTARINAANVINANVAAIVKGASNQLFETVPELLSPGGYAYTTRRYSACLRDMDYYLRYVSYALIAGNNDVLDERVLPGLRETYNSLGVPIAPTVVGIQIMKDMVKKMLADSGVDDTSFVDDPFDYLSDQFGDTSI